MNIIKFLYKNTLKHIFFKINKPIILSIHNQKLYSVRNFLLGKKIMKFILLEKQKYIWIHLKEDIFTFIKILF